MFYDIAKYPFLQQFITNADLIFEEWKTAQKKSRELNDHLADPSSVDHYTQYWVRDNGFHEDQIGYDLRLGDYNTFALFKKNYPVKGFDIESLFPITMNMLTRVPNLHYAAFFRMDPKSEVLQHIHNRKHMIFHVLLNDLENGACKMFCGEAEKILQHKGDSALFDYSIEHSTINASTSERINFVIDFNPFTDE